MRRLHLVPVLLALLTISSLTGCPGDPPPPPPPSDLRLGWATFDTLTATWEPPAEPVDGYQAEGRVGDGPFEAIPGVIPSDAIGGEVSLDPTTPELVTIGLRIRSIRGGSVSAPTPEVTIFRGLKAPANLTSIAVAEDVRLTWSQRSTAASGTLVERASWDATLQALGPYREVVTLPADATSYLDTTTSAPYGVYGYRISNWATARGETVWSEPALPPDTVSTTLSPPRDLRGDVVAGGVRLTWTPTSRNGTRQVVERTDVSVDAFEIIAIIDSASNTYLDPAPPAGAYRYRVDVAIEPIHYGWIGTDPVAVFVSPPLGPFGLSQEVIHVPYADGVAKDDGGRWWFARRWTDAFPADLLTLHAWAPAGTGWEDHPLGGGLNGEVLVEPGLLLDDKGQPQQLWVRHVSASIDVVAHAEVRHVWRDTSGWHDELVEASDPGGSTGNGAQFALDAQGAIHAVWRSGSFTGTLATSEAHYATNAGGVWTVTRLPVGALDPGTSATTLRVSAGPDGTAWVAEIGAIPSPFEPVLMLLRHEPDGSWSEERVPTGPMSFLDGVRMVARGGASIDLLLAPSAVAGPRSYLFLARSAAGWESPIELGQVALVSGYLLPSLVVSPDGQRRAALLELADGLALATWEPAAGWATERIHPTVPFDVPWAGFDASGVLDVLLPGGGVGADGMADRIHLRSTR